jgi:hypothetical protein
MLWAGKGSTRPLRHNVDSIEHGYGLDEALMDRMVKTGCLLVSDDIVGVYVAEGRQPRVRPFGRDARYTSDTPQRSEHAVRSLLPIVKKKE